MSTYLNEAFKQLRLFEEEDFDLSSDGLDNLGSFMSQAIDDTDTVDIIDTEATEEEELKKSYIGKIICDCNVCHSNIFYNKEDIIIDDKGTVNIDDECPYCMSNDGYTIVGEIKPYLETEESVEEEPVEDESEEDTLAKDDVQKDTEEDVTETEEPIEIGESLTEAVIDVDTEDNSTIINTEDESITIEDNEQGGKTITTSSLDDVSEDTDIIDEPLPGEGEAIAPLDAETEAEILNDDEMDDVAVEEPIEEEPAEEEAEIESDEDAEEESEEDVDLEDFDDEAFNELGEAFLRKTYGNVKSFKTTAVSMNENLLNISGIITFASGNARRTNFIFEAKTKKTDKLMFEGYNKQLNNTKKAFKLICTLSESRISPKSMTYKFKSLNESTEIKGRVKIRG